MKKPNRKVLIAVVAAVVVLVGATGFYLLSGNDGTDGISSVINSGDSGFPVAARDAQVYSVIEQFLKLQVENDRHAVLELLSTEHRAEWNDESYLVSEIVFNSFDEVRLGNLKMGVIDYQRNEGVNLASVYVSYSLLFVKNDKVVTQANIMEEVGLSENGEDWLIDLNIRSVMASNK